MPGSRFGPHDSICFAFSRWARGGFGLIVTVWCHIGRGTGALYICVLNLHVYFRIYQFMLKITCHYSLYLQYWHELVISSFLDIGKQCRRGGLARQLLINLHAFTWSQRIMSILRPTSFPSTENKHRRTLNLSFSMAFQAKRFVLSCSGLILALRRCIDTRNSRIGADGHWLYLKYIHHHFQDWHVRGGEM